MSDDDFLAELAELNRQYSAALPERLDAVRAALAALEAGDAAAVLPLCREAHYLAGTGGTFGLPAISTTAGALETLLLGLGGRGPDAAERIQISALTAALIAAAPGA
jgi:chemotaxis protein histidine kinase CheA